MSSRRFFSIQLRSLHCFCLIFILVGAISAQRLVENLGRGVVAINKGSGNVYISWRLLGNDPSDIAFNIYRSTEGADAVKLNTSPITATTDYSDKDVDITKSNAWFVKPVIGNVEQSASTSFTLPANAAAKSYLSLPLNPRSGYTTLHAYVGDLDGDGEYDYIVKRFPDDSTKNIVLEAYLNNGTYKWCVDLGPNMDRGNYTANPFVLVYDFDCDGKAEVFTASGEGTTFANGKNIGDANGDGVTDYRTFPPTTSGGYMLLADNCPEFISMLDGMTGNELARADYIPRGPKSNWTALWGDNYGHRMSFNFVGVAYFDGVHPSIITSRGEGTLMDIVAWDYGAGKFTKKWTWSSKGRTYTDNQHWADFHNIRIVDLDGDGKDEVSWGVNAMDDNGTPLYYAPSDLGHGDRFGIGDFDPSRPGLEAFVIQQHAKSTETVPLAAVYDAKTGKRIKTIPGASTDVGRGDVADIDPRYKGMEYFSYASGGVLNCKGDSIAPAIPKPALSIWWDGDLLREFLDASDGNGNNPIINKWNITTSKSDRLFSIYNEGGSYSTRTSYAGRPALYGDIMGDWREEIVCENSDRTELRIFSTSIPAVRRIYTLMHNPAYRLCINLKYYLPTPYPDFYLGDSMADPPAPDIQPIGVTPVVTFRGGKTIDKNEVIHLKSFDYIVNKETDISAYLYDLKGRIIFSLAPHIVKAGTYSLKSSFTSVPPGMYLLTLKAGTAQKTAMVQLY
ncbi:MAG TPA: hypothetical protein VKO63_11275 [Chitinispirillaceae bacterium]|nr:hypothetical protein [Chitinispirillaceae bacterium]